MLTLPALARVEEGKRMEPLEEVILEIDAGQVRHAILC